MVDPILRQTEEPPLLHEFNSIWDIPHVGDHRHGLAPVTMVYFRFRTLTSAGFSQWSTAISVIIH